MRHQRSLLFWWLLFTCLNSVEARCDDFESERQSLVQQERARFKLEEYERWLEAVDPGEAKEHTRRVSLEAIILGKVSKEEIFAQGEAIFDRIFTHPEGAGGENTVRIQNRKTDRGPDAFSCAECHSRGGEDGGSELNERVWFGSKSQTFDNAESRMAPHLAGAGFVQILAQEMTETLQSAKQRWLADLQAYPLDAPKELCLKAKGVSFGCLKIVGNGTVKSELEGVDEDLIVKPFGWAGIRPNLRDFSLNALPQHMSLDPTQMQPSEHHLIDTDKDGITSEINETQIASLAIYMALLDVPIVRWPVTATNQFRFRRGWEAFRRAGCDQCHVPEMELDSPKWNEKIGEQIIQIDLVADHQMQPTIERFDTQAPYKIHIFSDLKRHYLGNQLSITSKGVKTHMFLTRPLWGIGNKGTGYMHHGKAVTIYDAINLHQGEAAYASKAYSEFSDYEKGNLKIFLRSLVRENQLRIVP